MAGDLLEEEADRRGRDGYDVPVFYRGQPCGTKRKYSDGLLFARLKAIRPAEYREPKGAAPPAPQPVPVIMRDFALEDLARRLAHGETVDRTALPQRLQGLIPMADIDAGQSSGHRPLCHMCHFN